MAVGIRALHATPPQSEPKTNRQASRLVWLTTFPDRLSRMRKLATRSGYDTVSRAGLSVDVRSADAAITPAAAAQSRAFIPPLFPTTEGRLSRRRVSRVGTTHAFEVHLAPYPCLLDQR